MILVKLETPELNVIEESKALKIKATFEPMVKMLEEFENQYNSIVKDSEKEITKELTEKAKRLRLDVGKVRIKTDELRKTEKEEYLRAGKAIDGVSNILKWAVSEKENKLKEIEDYFEIQEQERLEKLQQDRAEKLLKYVENAFELSLSSMEEDVFNAYFQTKKKEHEDRIVAEKKAEEERIEQERLYKLKLERNDELKLYWKFVPGNHPDFESLSDSEWSDFLAEMKNAKESYDKEQEEIKQEKERLEKEAKKRQAQIEKERLERVKAEKLELEKREKLQAELKAKEEAEQKEKQRLLDEQQTKIKAEKAALLAPDKDKLIALSKRIMLIEMPELKAKEANDIMLNVVDLLSKIDSYIKEKVQNL